MYCQVWWPILEIGALHLTHPSAHTQQWVVNTHTHTPGAVGSHCSSARGAVGGSVPCSRAPQSWYWRWRECCSFTIPTFNPCRTWDLNPQPLDYKSDSLTIRPRLPPFFPVTLIECLFRVFNNVLKMLAQKLMNKRNFLFQKYFIWTFV